MRRLVRWWLRSLIEECPHLFDGALALESVRECVLEYRRDFPLPAEVLVEIRDELGAIHQLLEQDLVARFPGRVVRSGGRVQVLPLSLDRVGERAA